MTNECTFIRREADSKWVCKRCLRPSSFSGKNPPRRPCRFRVHAVVMCPMRAIVSRLTPAAVDRLQLCHAAECGEMVTEENVTRCGRLGKRCDGAAVWSAFLNGDRTCPHWKATSLAAWKYLQLSSSAH